MEMLKSLFDPLFLKKLESLRIECRKLYHGTRKGDYASVNKRGTSIEFADYQLYNPGDDFRYIDWNLYGRLDKLLIKTFKEELELTVHILIDASKSLIYPPEDKKFEYAKKIAVAFSYIGLSNQNSVRLATFTNNNGYKDNPLSPPFLRGKEDTKTKSQVNQDNPLNRTPICQKRSSIFSISKFLSEISPGGQIDFYGSLKKYLFNNRWNGGTILIISDFMIEPDIYKKGLSLLKFKNYDVKVIQVLGNSELDPFQKIKRGQIVDVETNEKRIINPTASLRKNYKDVIENHINNLKQFCRSNKIVYSLAKTDIKFEDYVLKELPKLGFVK